MEILSKSKQYNNIENEDYENNNIFTEDNYKYIFNLKMNKIKEEIKDYIIDKYRMKIIELNKEVNNIKNQFDTLNKKYLNLIRIIIENKNNIKILNANNIYISNIFNKNETITNNINKIIKFKNEHKKEKTRIFYNNLEKILNDKNFSSDENKRNNTYKANINNNNMNMDYLKELNKKDLKKLNSIKNEIKKVKTSNKLLINKECHKDYIYTKTRILKDDLNHKLLSNKNNSNYISKMKINSTKNRNKNINKENIITNYLTINTEEKKHHNKKFSIQMNSTRKNGVFKKINTNSNNFLLSNSIEDYCKTESNEVKSISKKKYNKNKLKGFKGFKFKIISKSLNESSKENLNDNQIMLNNTVKTRYFCNPVFGEFFDRFDNN